jgi:predicted nucleic acid-binding protein
MTLVVSDTSPVRALAHVGQLEFLKTLYGEVWVPPSVVAELASPRGRGPAVDAIAAGLLVSVGPVIDRLQAEIDFHVAPHIRRQILAQAGEADQSP